MRLEIEGLTRDQEVAWLMTLPWTFTSERADDPDEFVVRVREMPDAIVIGSEKEVGREIWESLRASLECRLDLNDPIPLPLAHILPAPPIVLFPKAAPATPRET